MKNIAMLGGACALAVAAWGCAPELDQTQLSPEEQAWAKSIKANYSAWQPPQSVPRSVRRDDVQSGNGANEVPAAVNAPGETAPAAWDNPAAPAAAPADNAAPATAGLTDNNAAAPAPIAAPADAAAAPAADETYTVAKGDTLGAIAQKFYGKASAWKRIQDANADVLKGKTLIRPGMKLRIPKP